MSSHFSSVKPRQLIKILEMKGFEQRRVTGSHHIFKHPLKGQIIPVPIHGNKELKRGTVRSILKQAEIGLDELNHLLKK